MRERAWRRVVANILGSVLLCLAAAALAGLAVTASTGWGVMPTEAPYRMAPGCPRRGGGGALGASARPHPGRSTSLAILGADFPWGTLLANGLGSHLSSALSAAWMSDDRASAGREDAHERGHAASFSSQDSAVASRSFSIFSLEMLMLLEAGRIRDAMFYLGASLIVWFSAVAAGFETGASPEPACLAGPFTGIVENQHNPVTAGFSPVPRIALA